MIVLTDLHDATLLRLEIEWSSGTLIFTIKIHVGDTRVARIFADGLTHLICPHQSPWGRSNSINEVHVHSSETEDRLKLEMQSGDVIEATAKNIRLES
jgi:hypothetical protein